MNRQIIGRSKWVAACLVVLGATATPCLLAGTICPPSGSVGTWVWDGGGDDIYWSDANNWEPNSVPPSGADVVIIGASGPVVMKYPAYQVTVQTLTCDGTLKLQSVPSGGPVLTVLDCATIDTLDLDPTPPKADARIMGPPGSVVTITNHLQSTTGVFGNSNFPTGMGMLFRVAQGATATVSGNTSISQCTFEIDGTATLDGADCVISHGGIFRVDNDGATSCGSVANPPGRLIMKNNAGIRHGDPSRTFIVNGCLITEGTGSAGHIAVRYQHNGSLIVSDGTQFRIGGGMLSTGSMSVGENATLDIARVPGGETRIFTATVDSSFTCAPTGTIRHYSGSGGTFLTIEGTVDVAGEWQQSPPGVGFGEVVNFNGSPKHFANLYHGGGGLSGNAPIMISDHMDWVNDSIALPTVSILTGADIDIMPNSAGGGTKHLYAALEVAGSAKVHADVLVNFWCGGGNCLLGVLHILPSGQLELENNCAFSGGLPSNYGSVLNEGTVITVPGHTTSIFFLPFNNAGVFQVNEGTVKFARSFTQTSGQTILNGGSLQTDWYWYPPFVFSGGTLKGNGEIIGDVVNNGGIIACGASPGGITIQGNFQQGPNGTFAVEIGGLTQGSEYDWLEVFGTATLNGHLTTTFINNFVPSLNNTFNILAAGSRVGTFAQCRYITPTLFTDYTATAVNIQAVLACPADIVATRNVNIDDLLAVINGWGPYTPPGMTCSADIFPNGGDLQVNIDDLLRVINEWGPCP